MISIEDAIKRTEGASSVLSGMDIGLSEALGYYLLEPVVSPIDMPLFDNAAMDGFAIRTIDQPRKEENRFVLKGVQPAGNCRGFSVGVGEAIKIMTGAPLPRGADRIVIRENAVETGNLVTVNGSPKIGQHIRKRGEEISKADTILPPGRRLCERDIGLLANFGIDQLRVARKPSVAIVTTGEELAQPGQPLRKGQIFDSNSLLLKSHMESFASAIKTLCVGDHPVELERVIGESLEESDVVMIVGGVSVGDYDYTRRVLDILGVEEIFWKVSQKPGKPMLFGRKENRLVFGLPGNPVSAWFCFFFYVLPILKKMQGASVWRPEQMNGLMEDRVERGALRTSFLRGIWQEKGGQLIVKKMAGQGSHMLRDLALCRCLIEIPAGNGTIEVGSLVKIYPLRG